MKSKNQKEKTFVTISNQQIYDEIQAYHLKIDNYTVLLNDRIIKLEGKISWISKLVIGSYGFTMFVLGIFINHVINNIK